MLTVSTFSQVPPSRNPARGLWRHFYGYRVERNNSVRELHPLKSSAFHGAVLRQLTITLLLACALIPVILLQKGTLRV
jgi:hypothetical protein